MLEELAKDYAAYMKLDISSGFYTVQDVIDNMLTRLEELNSVIQMIKVKNSSCSSTISEDIIKYRSEVTTLSKKIAILNEVIQTLQQNVNIIEKQVEKAEMDFGVHHEGKIKSFLRPFLMRNKEEIENKITVMDPPEKIKFQSVMQNFVSNESNNKD